MRLHQQALSERMGQVFCDLRIYEALNIDKEHKKIAKSIQFPGKSDVSSDKKTLTWNKRGGYAGQKTIKKVFDAAKAAGWKDKGTIPGASPSGSVMGTGTTYVDSKGNELYASQSYGITKADNSYFMTLKFKG